MPDLGDHEWPEMVRITTANVGIDAVELALNFSYSPSVEVAVEFNMSTQPSPLMPQQRPPNKGYSQPARPPYFRKASSFARASAN